MRLRSIVTTALVTLTAILPSLAQAQSQAQGNLSITHKTEIPGSTLNPGTYTIHVVDHLTDRYIMRIDNSAGKQEALFLGVNAPSLPKSGSAVEWQGAAGSDSALRGYAFPSGPSVEFVYPKADAVSLAKKNNSSVVAIDPASEGRKPKHMSGEDMQLVSLWLLTATRVGPKSEAAIAAKHFEAVPEKGPVVASTSPSTSSASNNGTQLAQTETRPNLIARRAATPKPRPVVKTLPHTASQMPLIWVLSIVSLLGALAIRRYRLA